MRAGSGAGGFVRARAENEALKAEERRIRLAQLKGELIDRDRAVALVFGLARQERDARVTWPARTAALMAAEVTAALRQHAGEEVDVPTGLMQQILEAHVRAHLAELAEPSIGL